MNAPYRRARLLALFLDVAIPAALADCRRACALGRALALLAGGAGSDALALAPAAAAALAAFLLRDARGGRARRWLALEVRDADGRPPGAWGSVRRNLPLLLPGWNALDAWPVLRDGLAPRRSDRRAGLRVVPCD